MIRLESDENEVSIVLEITRNEASLIAQALAPEWRFVEKVTIGPATQVMTPQSPAAKAKPSRSKTPTAKAQPAEKAKPKRDADVEKIVRERLQVGGWHPKSIADVLGPPYKDGPIRAALEALREAGEVEVTGQKRGTKYRLLNVGSEPDKAAE